MSIHIDFPPIKKCKHPELTYGEICVKCGECGRFEYGGASNPVRSDIKIIVQGNDSIPPFWRYPREFGGYYKGKNGKHEKVQLWYRSDKKMENGTKLQDLISDYWYPERKLEYVRWWIEGRNY